MKVLREILGGVMLFGVAWIDRLIFPASGEPTVMLAEPITVIAAVALASQLVGGFLSSRSAKKAAQREADRRKRIMKKIQQTLSPENFKRVFQKLQPIFREQVLAGFQPAVESQVATQLARRGATTTGLGQTLRGLAPAAAGIEASRQASGAAERQINARAAALQADLGFASPLEIQAATQPSFLEQAGGALGQINAIFGQIPRGNQLPPGAQPGNVPNVPLTTGTVPFQGPLGTFGGESASTLKPADFGAAKKTNFGLMR